MDFATGGGGGAGALAVLEVLSSAFRNVLMRRKRTTTDFFINPPFASGRKRTGRNYSNLGSHNVRKNAELLISDTPIKAISNSNFSVVSLKGQHRPFRRRIKAGNVEHATLKKLNSHWIRLRSIFAYHH